MSRARHLPVPLGLLLAVIAGVAIPAQGRINGALAGRLGDPLAAALVSFGGGLVLMLLLTAALPAGRAGARRILPAVRQGLPWWYLGAGLCGALFVISQSLTIGFLGIAVFTIASVTGQSVSGLVVDRVGFAQGQSRPITGIRLVATVLTLAAVAYAVTPKLGGGEALGPMLLLIVLPLISGFLQSFQSAMNGASSVAYGSPLTATLMNFISGTAGIAVAWGIKLAIVGPSGPLPGEGWYYLGGAMGCVFIAASAMLVRRLGVLLTGLGMIAGQLVGSLSLDLLVPAPGSIVQVPTVVGTCLTLVAIVLATLPWQRGWFRKA